MALSLEERKQLTQHPFLPVPARGNKSGPQKIGKSVSGRSP